MLSKRVMIFVLLFCTSCLTTKRHQEIREDEWKFNPEKKVFYTEIGKKKLFLKLKDPYVKSLICIEDTFYEDLTAFRDY